MMKYIVIEGATVGGPYAYKVYKVRKIREAVHNTVRYEILEPAFGTYFAIPKGDVRELDEGRVFKNLEDAKSYIKKEIIMSTFLYRQEIYKLEKLVKSMNEAK